jgi:hypothetical protein
MQILIRPGSSRDPGYSPPHRCEKFSFRLAGFACKTLPSNRLLTEAVAQKIYIRLVENFHS